MQRNFESTGFNESEETTSSTNGINYEFSAKKAKQQTVKRHGAHKSPGKKKPFNRMAYNYAAR